ncbi:biotin/lipoyl-binding protein [Sulfurimonas sp. HSL3-2]|uniref:efflux RND transporter periplasmic adaptor subunit n=1 Tax=Hydrocurvibacter mobilis TaxID=3131936 RepID=UPI0031F86BE0
MNSRVSALLRYTITFAVVSAAIVIGVKFWNDYMNGAWTRDGRVRADVVMVTADVSGIVSDLFVIDNQYVKQGTPLLQIDKERFMQALDEARALVDIKKAQYIMKKKRYQRRATTNSDAIPVESKDDSQLELVMAKAEYEQSLSLLQTAQLNLERSTVKAISDGWISNLLLKKGDYAKRGESRMALIKKDSFWVYGYFEEHKLSLIHVDDEVEMKMLGSDYVLKGHVESVARGISDRDNITGESLLANVNPTFTWVRLAQRIPVRIHIDEIPTGYTLIAGMTCSVSIKSTH